MANIQRPQLCSPPLFPHPPRSSAHPARPAHSCYHGGNRTEGSVLGARRLSSGFCDALGGRFPLGHILLSTRKAHQAGRKKEATSEGLALPSEAVSAPGIRSQVNPSPPISQGGRGAGPLLSLSVGAGPQLPQGDASPGRGGSPSGTPGCHPIPVSPSGAQGIVLDPATPTAGSVRAGTCTQCLRENGSAHPIAP